MPAVVARGAGRNKAHTGLTRTTTPWWVPERARAGFESGSRSGPQDPAKLSGFKRKTKERQEDCAKGGKGLAKRCKGGSERDKSPNAG
jgi:hypothetical protein